VRGAEALTTVRPGRSPDSAWSEGSKNYIRNVEAVGSIVLTRKYAASPSGMNHEGRSVLNSGLW
jgi:hypothetical protein